MAGKVVILGGTGKMGRWFAKFLTNKGFEVAIHSRFPEKAAKTAQELNIKYIESIDAAQNADMVVVSTSLSSTAETIRMVSKKIKQNKILFDIASVKSGVIDALKEASALGIRTVSIHPMFGPGATSIKGKHILIVPISEDSELIKNIINLFEGAETHIISSWEVHDMMIALTLSLPHLLNIVFSKTLTKTDILELNKFAGTTFNMQLMIAEAVYSEDADLYYEIQSQNEAFTKVIDFFLEATREVISTIKRKDRKAFVKSFEEVRTVFAKDPNFAKAYRRFYRAYEAIT